jgi:hypothetical protein
MDEREAKKVAGTAAEGGVKPVLLHTAAQERGSPTG